MLSCFYFNLPSINLELQHFPDSHRVLGGKEQAVKRTCEQVEKNMTVELCGHQSWKNIQDSVAKEY